VKRDLQAIDGDGMRLRLLCDDDLETTLSWRNRPEVRRWFHDPRVLPDDAYRRWYDEYRVRDNDFVFVVELTGGRPRPIGQASIYDIDWETGRGEFGRLMIGEMDATGKGHGGAATELLLSFTFSRLGLREIFLTVLTGNVPALRIYGRCGFVPLSRDGHSVTMRLTREAYRSRGDARPRTTPLPRRP
jgi:RimJ/RimL family protein N-acetyltransferase